MLPRVIDSNGSNAVVRALYGFVAYNKEDPLVGRAIEKYGEYSEGVVSLIRQVCHEGSVVVEVGAKFGAHSLALSRLVGQSGRILAVEPHQPTFQLLCATVALNSVDNVDCYRAIGGDLDPHGSATEAPVELDQLLDLKAVRLVKVDAADSKLGVLTGATRLINKHQPLLLVNNSDTTASRQLIQFIKSLNYRVFWHLCPLFRKDNQAGDPENLYPGQVAVHLFGYPESRPLELTGFSEVSVSDFNPVRLLEWQRLFEARRSPEAAAIHTAVNNTAPRRELTEALLALGVFAHQEDRLLAAQHFLGWLETIDADNWQAQFALAAVREQLDGPTAATQRFSQFVSKHPVHLYQQSKQTNALPLGTLLTRGNKDICFTVNGYKLPEGNTDTHHLTWNPANTLGTLFADAISAEHLSTWTCS